MPSIARIPGRISTRAEIDWHLEVRSLEHLSSAYCTFKGHVATEGAALCLPSKKNNVNRERWTTRSRIRVRVARELQASGKYISCRPFILLHGLGLKTLAESSIQLSLMLKKLGGCKGPRRIAPHRPTSVPEDLYWSRSFVTSIC